MARACAVCESQVSLSAESFVGEQVARLSRASRAMPSRSYAAMNAFSVTPYSGQSATISSFPG